MGFTLSFLYAGKESVARRYAAHLPEWVPYDRIGSLFAALLIASVLVFLLRFLGRLGHARSSHDRPDLPRTLAAA
jgi:cytochrome c oxidase subunit 1